MKDIINKIKGFGKKKETEKPLSAEDERRAVLAKEKEKATKDGEPWVGVLDTKVNPENIRNGFFELDWNNEFVEKLIDAGYSGSSPEEIVDGWFKTIARQILDDEGLDKERNSGYINTSNLGDDKSEVK
tara:strand:+ start:161 stop:547 length:387 start_codon:yes stop_codon:yes gene_type:complete